MKTKISIIKIICIGYLSSLSFLTQGQTTGNDSLTLSRNYDVQCIYDKEGNLIYYDSTYVDSDLYKPENEAYDSLISALKEDDRRINYSIRFPKDSFSLSFQLPERFFDYAPDYRFDIEVPKFDSLLSGFDYYFSLSPSDSTADLEEEDPGIEFHGSVPEVNPDLDKTIWEIERRMRELNDRLWNDYNSWQERQDRRNEQEERNEQDNMQAIPKEEDVPPSGQEELGNVPIEI